MKQAIEKLNQKQQYERGCEIVKYQNFKTDIALVKMKAKMSKCVFNAGVTYLKRGIKTASLSEKLKKVLDSCVSSHIQPLTPAVGEKREFKKPIYQNKEAKPPVCNLSITKKKLTSQFEYGVLVDDCIKLFDTETEARAFLKGILFLNKVGNLVQVEKTIVR